MVDVLTESGCSRYIEFRSVSGIFNYTTSGQIEQVSSADVLKCCIYIYMKWSVKHTHTLTCLNTMS